MHPTQPIYQPVVLAPVLLLVPPARDVDARAREFADALDGVAAPACVEGWGRLGGETKPLLACLLTRYE